MGQKGPIENKWAYRLSNEKGEKTPVPDSIQTPRDLMEYVERNIPTGPATSISLELYRRSGEGVAKNPLQNEETKIGALFTHHSKDRVLAGVMGPFETKIRLDRQEIARLESVAQDGNGQGRRTLAATPAAGM